MEEQQIKTGIYDPRQACDSKNVKKAESYFLRGNFPK